MPIHPPRNRTKKKEKSREEVEVEELFKMFDNWLTMTEPHKYGLHYPDFSCCHPQLESAEQMKQLMVIAVKDGNREIVTAMQQAFEQNYRDFVVLRIKEDVYKRAEKSCEKNEDEIKAKS